MLEIYDVPGVPRYGVLFEEDGAYFGGHARELSEDAEFCEKANFDEKGELYCC